MSKMKYAIDSSHVAQWSQRIGKIVINFSAIEMECAHWIVQLSEGENSVSSVLAMQFSKKVKKLTGHIEKRSTSKRWRKESLRAWNDAIKLSNVRNLVAHNPVMFFWYSPIEAGDPDFIGLPNPRAIKLPRKETSLSRQDADQAINEMASLACKLESLRREWCEIRDAGGAPPVQRETRQQVTSRLKLLFEGMLRKKRHKL